MLHRRGLRPRHKHFACFFVISHIYTVTSCERHDVLNHQTWPHTSRKHHMTRITRQSKGCSYLFSETRFPCIVLLNKPIVISHNIDQKVNGHIILNRNVGELVRIVCNGFRYSKSCTSCQDHSKWRSFFTSLKNSNLAYVLDLNSLEHQFSTNLIFIIIW